MKRVAALVLLASFGIGEASAGESVGGSCSPDGVEAVSGGVILKCVSGAWAANSVQVGNDSATCDSAKAGAIRWSGSALQYCNGSAWGAVSSGSSQWTTTGSDIYYNTGNVGIGVNDPEAKLHVEGNVIFDGDVYGGAFVVFGFNGWYSGFNAFWNGSGWEYITDDYAGYWRGDNGALTYSTMPSGTAGNTGTPTERLRITNDGSVGIGTADPEEKLHVAGGSILVDNNSSVRFKDNGGGEVGSIGMTTANNFGFANNAATGSIQVELVNNSGSIQFYTTTSSTLRMEIENDGDLKMGATKSSVGSSALCWDGSGSSYWGACSSLRQFKDNIADLSIGLETVLKLRPVEFDWNGKKIGAQGHDLGFIAEEVEAVNPLLAEYGGENGALSGVKYNTMAALLTKAIQELKAANDNLRLELKAANDNEASTLAALRAESARQAKEIKELRAALKAGQ